MFGAENIVFGVMVGVSRSRARRSCFVSMSWCLVFYVEMFRPVSSAVFRVCTHGVLFGLFCRSCFVKTGMFCSTCFVSLDGVFRFAEGRVSSKSSVTVVKRNGDERFLR